MEHERKYFQINTKDIVIDPDSQRDASKRKNEFNYIMRHFKYELVNPIKVASYNEKYICYDGQMTMEVLKARNNGKDLPVDCMVTFNLTGDEIKELFVLQNGKTCPVSLADKIRVESNKEEGGEKEAEFIRVVERNGFKISKDSLSRQPNAIYIQATKALWNEFNAFENSKDFDTFLYILHEGFKDDPMQTNNKILGGLGLFVRTYIGQFEINALIKTLQTIRAADIIRDAEVDRTHGMRKYAVKILQAYNNHRHKQYRLENIL